MTRTEGLIGGAGLLVLLLGAMSASGDGETESGWPQYRGPLRNGVSTDRGLIQSWPEGGPRELWRMPIGPAFSGIAVVGERVYTMEAGETAEYAVCLDARTGREIWRAEVGGVKERSWGNGPATTPTVSDGMVYALGALGRLVALDAETGEVRWQLDYGEAFGGEAPRWGYTSSAVVVGDRLVVQPGGPGGAGIVALDRKTGEVLWKAHHEKAGYSSPAVIDYGGVRQLVYLTPANVISVSEDGRVLWSHPFAPEVGTKPAMPVFVAPDLLFVSASYDIGALTLRLTGAADGIAVEEVWRDRVMRNHFNSSVVRDGHLYGFDNATLKCIEVRTGEQCWSKRGGLGKGSMIYADGDLIVLSERGKLLLVAADPESYREKASHQVLEGRSWTEPALADGKLYLRNLEEIVCLDLRG